MSSIQQRQTQTALFLSLNLLNAKEAKEADFHFDAKKFCQNIFLDIDSDKDGYIDFNEFFKLAQILQGVWRKGEEKSDFDTVDTNRDEKISLSGIFSTTYYLSF